MVLNQFAGRSAWAESLRRRVLIAAPFSSNVLVWGPSGTGKELIARALHQNSTRANGPFVPVDCASLAGDLLASHLFGHVKGSFTGADHERLGCFRVADGGTLLLDEIGEMSLPMQANLLRTLQEREVLPVGSDKPCPVDVRVIAATNRDLLSEVTAGRFRLDLYYRLNVISIETVAIAQRPEDLEPLADHILAKLTAERGFPALRCSQAALDAMRNYSWPGNVRELQNVLERAAVFAIGDEIGPEAIPRDGVQSPSTVPAKFLPGLGFETDEKPWPTLADVEREHIAATLAESNYNQSIAAARLGIDRGSLARKIARNRILLPPARRGRPSSRP